MRFLDLVLNRDDAPSASTRFPLSSVRDDPLPGGTPAPAAVPLETFPLENNIADVGAALHLMLFNRDDGLRPPPLPPLDEPARRGDLRVQLSDNEDRQVELQCEYRLLSERVNDLDRRAGRPPSMPIVGPHPYFARDWMSLIRPADSQSDSTPDDTDAHVAFRRITRRGNDSQGPSNAARATESPDTIAEYPTPSTATSTPPQATSVVIRPTARPRPNGKGRARARASTSTANTRSRKRTAAASGADAPPKPKRRRRTSPVFRLLIRGVTPTPSEASRSLCQTIKSSPYEQLPDYSPPSVVMDQHSFAFLANDATRPANFRPERGMRAVVPDDDRISEMEHRFVLSWSAGMSVDRYLEGKKRIFLIARWRTEEDGCQHNIESSQRVCGFDVKVASTMHKWFSNVGLFDQPWQLHNTIPRPDWAVHVPNYRDNHGRNGRPGDKVRKEFETQVWRVMTTNFDPYVDIRPRKEGKEGAADVATGSASGSASGSTAGSTSGSTSGSTRSSSEATEDEDQDEDEDDDDEDEEHDEDDEDEHEEEEEEEQQEEQATEAGSEC